MNFNSLLYKIQETIIKALVIYDSTFGNTEKVAKAIGSSISAPVKPIKDVKPNEFNGFDLLFVGSPTQGGRPTQAVQDFLNKIPDGALKNTTVAAFDTRFAKDEHGFGLKVLMAIIDFAAPKIAVSLEEKGGQVAGKEGFIVADKEGPLAPGELERAKTWAKALSSTVKQ